jgi:hypothetical protein
MRVFLALALAMACALAQSQQQRSNPALPCYLGLTDDPRFVLVRGKVALGGTIDEIQRLPARDERPSPQEIPVLGLWRDAREACNKLEQPYLEGRDGDIVATVRQHYASVQALIGQLQAGSMTYGEFGKRRVELYERTTRRVEELRKSIVPPKLQPKTLGN